MKAPKQPVSRVNRLEKRANKLMDKAQSKWTKAEAIRKNYSGSNLSEGKYDQLINRSTRLADKAKSKATKASYLRDKTGMAPSPIKSQSKSKFIESSTKRKRGM